MKFWPPNWRISSRRCLFTAQSSSFTPSLFPWSSSSSRADTPLSWMPVYLSPCLSSEQKRWGRSSLVLADLAFNSEPESTSNARTSKRLSISFVRRERRRTRIDSKRFRHRHRQFEHHSKCLVDRSIQTGLVVDETLIVLLVVIRLVFSRAIDSCLSDKQNNNVRLFLAGDHLALERKSNRTDWLCPFEESHVDIDASWWLRTRQSDQRRYIQCIRLVGGWKQKRKTLFSLFRSLFLD